MSERKFGESDHEPLKGDDVLKQAIAEWQDELPTRDLWSGIQSRIETQTKTAARGITLTLPQLAMAATLLIAVAWGLSVEGSQLMIVAFISPMALNRYGPATASNSEMLATESSGAYTPARPTWP